MLLKTLGLQFKWSSQAGPIVVLSYKKRRVCLALLCHRREDRCIKFFGHTFLCARCTGICIGAIMMCLATIFGIVIPTTMGVVFTAPLLFDGFSQLLKVRESNNGLRLSTGVLFSIGFLSLIVQVKLSAPALKTQYVEFVVY